MRAEAVTYVLPRKADLLVALIESDEKRFICRAFLGATRRIRTDDLLITNEPLDRPRVADFVLAAFDRSSSVSFQLP